MADKHIYVDPDVDGGGADGTTWADAYASLNVAETAEDADITGIGVYYFHCKSRLGNADTTAVTFLTWTTDATHWIQVQGGYAAGEAGTPGTPEGLSAYSTTHYHMTSSDAGIMSLSENYVRLDKLQFYMTITANNEAHILQQYGTDAGNDIRISNCIITGTGTGTGAMTGIRINDADALVSIWNCLVYDFDSDSDPGDIHFRGIWADNQSTTNIWNCTINNCSRGIENDAGTVNAVNCLVFENDDDFLGTITVTYCASDDDHTGDSVTNFVITQTADDYAALVTDADGGDYSVTDGSSELVGAGTDDPGGAIQDDTDIAGTARSSTWDIGAFELSAVGGVTIPIFVHHYKQVGGM